MEFSSQVTWFEKTAPQKPVFEALSETLECDVCVVGGNFTAVSAALYAAEKGFKVVLLEGGSLGFGCTGRAGGILEGGFQASLDDLAEFHGRLNAHILWNSSIEALENIFEYVKKYKIACDLNQGHIYTSRQKFSEKNDLEFATYYGGHFEENPLKYIPKEELGAYVNMPKLHHGVYASKGGAFNPVSYLYGLVGACVKSKVKIYENSPVLNVEKGEIISISTQNGAVKCKNLIVCGNAFMGEALSPERTRTVSTKFFQWVSEPIDKKELDKVFSGVHSLSERRSLSCYLQITEDGRIIYGGRNICSENNLEKCAEHHLKTLKNLLPTLSDALKTAYFWSGEVGVPMNYVPIFERVAENHFLAHGFNGQGVVISAFGGKIMVDALLGEDQLFDIYSRIKPKKMSEFVRRTIAKASLFVYKLFHKPFNG